MNDTPNPLEPATLDELLSAALDGELDAAAHDLGITTADAEARIRATPGADERRVALATARDLLARAPDVDELLAARLRAKAVRAAEADTAARTAARRQRRNRIVLSAGGLAAAIAAVVAVAAGINGFQTSSSSKSSASAPAANDAGDDSARPKEFAPATAEVPALGAFADEHSLAVAALQKEAVARALDGGNGSNQNQSKSAHKPAPSTTAAARAGRDVIAPDSEQRLGAPLTPTGNGTATATDSPRSTADDSFGNSSSAGAAARCGIPPEVQVGDTTVLRATATLSGKPVIVFAFARDGEHVVVIEDTHCKLVNLQTFP